MANEYSVNDLREYMREHGLIVGGTRPELWRRFLAHQRSIATRRLQMRQDDVKVDGLRQFAHAFGLETDGSRQELFRRLRQRRRPPRPVESPPRLQRRPPRSPSRSQSRSPSSSESYSPSSSPGNLPPRRKRARRAKQRRRAASASSSESSPRTPPPRRQRRRKIRKPPVLPAPPPPVAAATPVATPAQPKPHCSICLDEFDPKSKKKIKVCNACHGSFHQRCLDRWLRRSVHPCCPLCRKRRRRPKGR